MNADSILQAIAHTTAANPEKVALVSGTRQLTFCELDNLSSNIAANLLTRGLQRGDRVALHLYNGWEIGACYLACLKAGLIAVPINTRFIASEIDYVMDHSGAALFIGQSELNSYVPNVAAIHTGSRAFEDLCAVAILTGAQQDPDAPAAILYTSGSTARPKGVIHTSRTMLGNALQTIDVGLNADDVVPVFLPMVHASGLMMLFLGPLAAGATQILIPRFDPPPVLEVFAESHGTFLFGLSMHCLALVRAGQQSGTRLPEAALLHGRWRCRSDRPAGGV